MKKLDTCGVNDAITSKTEPEEPFQDLISDEDEQDGN